MLFLALYTFYLRCDFPWFVVLQAKLPLATLVLLMPGPTFISGLMHNGFFTGGGTLVGLLCYAIHHLTCCLLCFAFNPLTRA